QAVQDLPVQTSVLAPFVSSVDALVRVNADEQTREQRLLTRKDLTGTSMAMATDALLIEQKDGATALLPLTANAEHVIDAERMRAELARSGVERVYFIDLKAETDKLYNGYMHEAVLLALCGMLAMTVMLGFTIRSAAGLARVMIPLVVAVLSVAAFFAATGERMTILHLVGLLLIVAVGSNYALFFAQPPKDEHGNPSAIAPTT